MSSKSATSIQELIFILRPWVVFRVSTDFSKCRWKNASLPLLFHTHTLIHLHTRYQTVCIRSKAGPPPLTMPPPPPLPTSTHQRKRALPRQRQLLETQKTSSYLTPGPGWQRQSSTACLSEPQPIRKTVRVVLLQEDSHTTSARLKTYTLWSVAGIF